MYDSVRDKNFLIGLNPDQSLPFWWDDAEPLWVTAEKQVCNIVCPLKSPIENTAFQKFQCGVQKLNQ